MHLNDLFHYDIKTQQCCQLSVTTRVSVLTGSFSKNSCNVQRITRKCNANEKLTITHITEVKMSV